MTARIYEALAVLKGSTQAALRSDLAEATSEPVVGTGVGPVGAEIRAQDAPLAVAPVACQHTRARSEVDWKNPSQGAFPVDLVCEDCGYREKAGLLLCYHDWTVLKTGELMCKRCGYEPAPISIQILKEEK